MPEPQTLSKTLLLKMLEESGTTALETLRALPPAAFEQGAVRKWLEREADTGPHGVHRVGLLAPG